MTKVGDDDDDDDEYRVLQVLMKEDDDWVENMVLEALTMAAILFTVTLSLLRDVSRAKLHEVSIIIR